MIIALANDLVRQPIGSIDAAAFGLNAIWLSAGCRVVKWTQRSEGKQIWPGDVQPAVLIHGLGSVPAVMCLSGEKLFTLDVTGQAALWQASSGLCLARSVLSAPLEGVFAQISESLVAVVTRKLSDDSERALHLIDIPSLTVLDSIVNSHSLALFEKDAQAALTDHCLDLTLCNAISASYLASIDSQGCMHFWPMSGHVLSEISQDSFKTILLKSKEELSTASFAADGKSLLVVTKEHIYFFVSDDWLLGFRSWDLNDSLSLTIQPSNAHLCPTAGSPAFDSSSRQQASSTLGNGQDVQGRKLVQPLSSSARFKSGILLKKQVVRSASEDKAGFMAILLAQGQGTLIWWSSLDGDQKGAEPAGTFRCSSRCMAEPKLLQLLSSFISHTLSDGPWQCQDVIVAVNTLCNWLDSHGLEMDVAEDAENHGRIQSAPLRSELPDQSQHLRGSLPLRLLTDYQDTSKTLLIEGFPDGTVTARSLVGALSGASSKQLESQHTASITSMMIYLCEMYDSCEIFASMSLLLTGSSDGSLSAVSLPGGELHLHMHLAAASVCAIYAPPPGTAYPWSTRIIMLAEDNSAFLLDLEQKSCVASLTGLPYPPSGMPQLAWSPELGYVAALFGPIDPDSSSQDVSGFWPTANRATVPPQCQQSENHCALAWNFQTGGLDRIVTGKAAISFFDQIQASPETDSSSAEPGVHLVSVQCQPSLSEVLLLHLDLDAALSSGDSDKGRVIPQLVLTLACLHIWAVDAAVDRLLRQACTHLKLLDSTSLGTKRLLQFPVQEANKFIAIQLSGERDGKQTAELYVNILAVAAQLEALATQLRDDQLTALCCNLAASLTALYSVQISTLAPQLGTPSLIALTILSEDGNSFRRAAAGMLLSCLQHGASTAHGYSLSGLFGHLEACEPAFKLVDEEDKLLVSCAVVLHAPSCAVDGVISHLALHLLELVTANSPRQLLAAQLLRSSLQSPQGHTWLQAICGVSTLLHRLSHLANQSRGSQLKRLAPASSTPAQTRSARRPVPALRSHASDQTAKTSTQSGALLGVKHSQDSVSLDNAILLGNCIIAILGTAAALDAAAFNHRLLDCFGGEQGTHTELQTLTYLLQSKPGAASLAPFLLQIVPLMLQHANCFKAEQQGILEALRVGSVNCPLMAVCEQRALLAIAGIARQVNGLHGDTPKPAPLNDTDHLAVVFDLFTGQKRALLVHRQEEAGTDVNSSITALAFDPGGARLAAICPKACKLRVWDVAKRPLRLISGSTATLSCFKVFNLRLPSDLSGNSDLLGLHWTLKWDKEAISIFYKDILYGRAVIPT